MKKEKTIKDLIKLNTKQLLSLESSKPTYWLDEYLSTLTISELYTLISVLLTLTSDLTPKGGK